MSGQGVSNYSVDKPSYEYSNATTEFDDALIRRGVLTLEQTIVAKGASSSEAQRLAAQAKKVDKGYTHEGEESDHQNSDDDEFDDDEDFLEHYRAKRLAELKEQQRNAATDTANTATNYFGQVIPIQRPEWKHHVNEASEDAWVVVTLTSHNVHVTGPIQEAVGILATQCPSVKFVTIPSTSAIDQWPDSNLPSVFVYRHGKMTREFIQMKQSWSPLQLLEELASAGDVEFSANEIQNVKAYESKLQEDRYRSIRRHMALGDDEEDGDEVE